jgi:hypothetical protein
MKGGESLGDEESSKEEKEVIPALILASGVRPLAPDVKSHLNSLPSTVTASFQLNRRDHVSLPFVESTALRMVHDGSLQCQTAHHSHVSA